MAWMAKNRASTFHKSLKNFASEMDQVAANWLRGQLYVGQVHHESWTMPRNLQVLAPQNASTNHDSLPACAPARYASAPVALTRENLSAKSFAQVVRQLRKSQNNAQYTSTTTCIVRYGCQVSKKSEYACA